MQGSKILALIGGPLAGLVVGMLIAQSASSEMSMVAGTAVCMAIWWITEAISIYVTALLPAVLFPLLGVMSMKQLAPAYFPQILFLFIGGFLLAFALEKWNLHKRIALRIILGIGTQPHRILLGFMLASYLLSWWILNTATVMMLLPAVMAVIKHLEEHRPAMGKQLAVPLLLGIAFASSVGGTATLIGTMPNLFYAGYYNETLAAATPVTFASWMAFGVPLSMVLFALLYGYFRYRYLRTSAGPPLDIEFIKKEYAALGKPGFQEWTIAAIFGTTVLAWFFAKPLDVGSLHVPGWTSLLPEPGFITESTIAMAAALLLFLIPAGKEHAGALLSWREAQKLPYGILLLFGGGFALAKGVTDTGLGALIGEQLAGLEAVPVGAMVLVLCLFMTFFTELTSNTASTVLLLPIIATLGIEIGIEPMLLMLPLTLSASYAFMLPVATPPNTIVFGSDRLTVRDMARAGLWLNLIGAVVTWALVMTLGGWLYGW